MTTIATSAAKRMSGFTGIIIAIGGLAVFLLTTSLMLGRALTAFDEALLLAFRNPVNLAIPHGPHWLEGGMADITALGGTVVLTLVTLFLLGALLILRHTHSALLLLGAIPGGVIISQTLKSTIARPRPDVVPHLVDITSLSFPSGHAMMATIAWLTIGALLARLAPTVLLKRYILAVAIFLSFLIGLSRIYLGVHWPSDVVAGWALGATWASTVWMFMRRFDRS